MMILFELLPKKSNLGRNWRPARLETRAGRQQKCRQKIASSRKHGIKQEQPQAVISFEVPVARDAFLAFSALTLLKMKLT